MKPYLSFCLLLLIIAGCRQPAQNKEEKVKKEVNHVNAEANNDTLLINRKTALRINLDSAQIEKLKKKYAKRIFTPGRMMMYFTHLWLIRF